MKIFLHEITDQEMELDFTQDDAWVSTCVFSVDENQDHRPKKLKARPISAHFSLRKVDEVVVASGRICTHIELLCSRCAAVFQHPCNLQFSALFCRDPVMAGVAHLQKQGNRAGKPQGQNQGHARHAHQSADDDDVMAGKDLDITYLSQDFIDLSDVLLEQLQLQVPFQPLCLETCKGMCTQCGADLNKGKCACSKFKSNPFSILGDFKV